MTKAKCLKMIRLVKYSRIYFFSMLWITVSTASGQDGPVNILTPEAAAFTKYGNVPVSTYTGTANVSVPLFTIQDGDINLPISVNYHTGGIKVQEEATWVGLGWSLDAGGQITRTIRGKDDFVYNPNYYNYLSSSAINTKLLFNDGADGTLLQSYLDPSDPDAYWGSGPVDTTELLLPSHSGVDNFFDQSGAFNPYNYDWVSDLFFFSAGPNSGKFVFDDDGLPMTLKKTNVSISLFGGDNFQITDGKGVIYTYTLRDLNHCMLTVSPDFISTWYLTSIKTADGNDSVTFQYGGATARSNDVSTTKATVATNGTVTYNLDSNYNTQIYSYLTEIDFRAGKILFQSSDNRLDVNGQRQLDSVIVYDTNTKKIKKYAFNYSYFTTSTNLPSGPTTFYNDRLKLDSIVIDDSAGISFSFNYNTTNVPSKLGGVDHWGYSNNAGYGIPNGIYEVPNGSIDGQILYTYQQVGGGDYEAHWPYTEAMTLQKVTYPTKGYTQLAYETNQFGNVPAYWQYSLPPYNPTNVVLAFPLDSIDLGPLAIPGTLNGFYNIYCHFNCPDTTDLQDFVITIKDASGNVYLQDRLSDFTHSPYNFDYYLTINNEPLSGNLYCEVDDTRENRNVSASNFYYEWQLTLTWINPATGPAALVYNNVASVNGGGLRLHMVTDADATGNLRYKQYSYNNPNGTTSGVIMNYPDYLASATYTTNALGVYAYLSSTSVIGLSTSASGSYIGYSHVTETDGDSVNNIGTTVNDYTNATDVKPFQYGFGLPCLQNVENGLLLKSVQYDVHQNEIQETDNIYPNYTIGIDTNWKSSTAVIVTNNGTNFSSGPAGLSLAPIYFWRDFQLDFRLQTNVKSVFSSSSETGPVVTTAQYQYGPNVNPQKVTVTTSTARQDQTEYRYANDFTSGSVPAFVQDMQTYNILDKPIETVTSKIINGAEMAITGVLNQFGTGNTRGLVLNQYSLDLASPLSWDDASFSSALSGSSFTFNPNYALKNSFDFLAGNIVNYRNRQQAFAYLWNYNYKYPIASCINAANNQIAYTSFEADSNGNWTIGSASRMQGGITGGSSYSLNSDISRTGLTSSTSYIVSYWTTNNAPFNIPGTASNYPIKGKTVTIGVASWTYYEHLVTGESTIQINGTGGIDELRLYPSGAQMTTYTYNPLVGISSQCDVAGRITYYFYDSFGRLSYVKDQDGNVIKTYGYHYTGQATH
jgi:hypothetical protein